jgi:hypothetical protein
MNLVTVYLAESSISLRIETNDEQLRHPARKVLSIQMEMWDSTKRAEASMHLVGFGMPHRDIGILDNEFG